MDDANNRVVTQYSIMRKSDKLTKDLHTPGKQYIEKEKEFDSLMDTQRPFALTFGNMERPNAAEIMEDKQTTEKSEVMPQKQVTDRTTKSSRLIPQTQSEVSESQYARSVSLENGPMERSRQGEIKRAITKDLEYLEELDDENDAVEGQIKTELEERNGHTRYEIMKGWWMSGEYMVFLTKCPKEVRHSQGYAYNLELYKFNELGKEHCFPLSFIEIFQSNQQVKIFDEKSSNQQFLSLVVREHDLMKKKLIKLKIILIDSSLISVTKKKKTEQQAEKEYNLPPALRVLKIDFKALNIQCTNEHLYQLFYREQKTLDLRLVLFIQTLKLSKAEEHAINAFSTQKSQLSVENPIQNNIYVVDLKQFFSHSQQQLKSVNQNQVLSQGFLPVSSIAYAGKKVIGLFRNDNLLFLAFEDGQIEYNFQFNCENDNAQTRLITKARAVFKKTLLSGKTQKAQVNLPFENSQKCFSFVLGAKDGTHRRFSIMFEGPQNEYVGYSFNPGKNSWDKRFQLPRFKYELYRGGFGRCLIGIKQEKTRRVGLLELDRSKESLDNQYHIATQIPLEKSSFDTRFEIVEKSPNFGVKYDRNSHYFTWYRSINYNIYMPQNPNLVTQVRDKYFIEISQENNTVTFSSLEYFLKGQIHSTSIVKDQDKFTLELPKISERKEEVQSFYPVMSKSKKTMILLMCVQTKSHDASQHSLVSKAYNVVMRINLEEQTIVNIPNKFLLEPIIRIFFVGSSEDRLLCQTKGGVYVTDFDFSCQNLTIQKNLVMPQKIWQLFENKNDRENQGIDVINDKFYFFQQGKMQVNSLKVNKLLQDNEKEPVRPLNVTDPESTPFISLVMKCKSNKYIKTKAQIEKPQEQIQPFLWRIIFSKNFKKMFALFSDKTSPFSWIQSYTINKETKKFDFDESTTLLPHSNCFELIQLNSQQLLVQMKYGFVVIKMPEKGKTSESQKIFACDYSSHPLKEKITVSQGILALPKCHRIKNGTLFNFGTNVPFAELLLMKKDDKKQFKCHTLNSVRYIFQTLYGKDIYLKINRQDLEDSQMMKILPIRVMKQDIILNNQSRVKYQINNLTDEQTIDKDQVNVTQRCETSIIQHLYQITTSIFESLIRRALIKGILTAEDYQLNDEHKISRIINPVLNDNNRNIIHHLSAFKYKKLRKIFNSLAFSQFCQSKQFTHHYCIFLDFKKQSGLKTALESSDFKSFDILLKVLVNSQADIVAAHIVEPLLLKAIKLNLDLNIAFNSKLFTMQLNTKKFQLFQDQFPQLHAEKRTKTVEFKSASIAELKNSPEIYSKYFKGALKNPQPTGSKLDKYSIQYTVDYIFLNSDEYTHSHSKFIQLLSQTKNLSYFRSPFIQRLIDHHWMALKPVMYCNTIAYFVIYAIVFVIAALSDTAFEDPDVNTYATAMMHYEPRFFLYLIDSVLLIGLVARTEFRQCSHMGLKKYFLDVDNIIDSFFIFSFFFSFLCNSLWGTDIAKNSFAVGTRAGLAELLLVGFMKGINTMRVHTTFSFLTRLIGKVLREIIPFMFLFITFTIITAMIFHTLGVHLFVYDDDPAFADPSVEPTPYTGLNWFGHFIFTLTNSNGEFDLEPIRDLKEKGYALYVLGWIFWLFVVFMNLIVFLNFVIALITDVYTVVMQTKEEETYKKKCELISEYIQLEADYYKKIYKKTFWPSVLMHRQKRNYDENENQIIAEIKNAQIETQKTVVQQTQRLEKQFQALKKNQDFMMKKLDQLEQQNKDADFKAKTGTSHSSMSTMKLSKPDSKSVHDNRSSLMKTAAVKIGNQQRFSTKTVQPNLNKHLDPSISAESDLALFKENSQLRERLAVHLNLLTHEDD